MPGKPPGADPCGMRAFCGPAMTGTFTTLVDEIAATAGALRSYVRLIAALLLREVANRRRAPMESFLALMEPVTAMATTGFLFWFLGRRTMAFLGGSPVLYYCTGFLAIYFFIYVANRIRALDSPNRRYPIEQRLDYILVHVLLRIGDYAILGLLTFGTIYFVFTPAAFPHDIVPVLQACVAIVMLGFGWGVFNLVIARVLTLWTHIAAVISRSLLFLSGVFYVPDFLAPSVRDAISYNPMLHALALFRQGFYPSYPTLMLDTNYLAWCAIGAVVVGLVLERASRRIEQN
jgi:capsular polysaccharide transport system permease protein